MDSFRAKRDKALDAVRHELDGMTEREAQEKVYEMGFEHADALVPIVLDWARGVASQAGENLVLLKQDDKYIAGIGKTFIEGPSFLGCICHLAALLLEEAKEEKSNIILPGA